MVCCIWIMQFCVCLVFVVVCGVQVPVYSGWYSVLRFIVFMVPVW